MSLLGMEFDIKGHYFKPFYLILGVLFFLGLLIFLGIVYSYYYIKYTLVDYIDNIKRERKMWLNKK
jgi:hypothetical protein